MGRRSMGVILILLILAGILLALLGWQFIRFRASLDTLPDGITMAGLDGSGMTAEQLVTALEAAFTQPVQLNYQDQSLALRPESVAFQFNPEATQEVIEEAVAERMSWESFLAYLMRRPSEQINLSPVASYSPDRLNGFLNRVAQQYDRPPQAPVPLPEALTFRGGHPGYELDIEASQERVGAALLSAVERHADLVIQVEEAPSLEIEQLEEMINALLRTFDGIPSIFVKDLQTGDEMEINPDVAYAGTSVLKIAVMAETFRALDQSPTPQQTSWLTYTMGHDPERSNPMANMLLQEVIGTGDGYQGVENLTASMHYLGLINTFMATPYDEEVVPPTIITPANSRTDLNTNPDPYMQTTARDMGLLLEMIYQCAHDGGALMVAYPDAFTADECQQMLDIMRQNQIDSLIETGVPPETPVAHKHGWVGDTHADAGIIFGENGDFVLVIFLYRPEWLEWDLSNALISDIATATYNYFNPNQ